MRNFAVENVNGIIFLGKEHIKYFSLNTNKTNMKKYNFNAGPSILPREVIEATAAAC